MLVLAGLGCGIAAAQTAQPPASQPAASTANQNPVPMPPRRPRVATPPPWIATQWSEPKSFREAAGEDFKTDEVTAVASACRQRLSTIAVIAPMPRLIGPGACGGGDIVRVDAVLVGGRKVEIKPAPYLQCPMAEQLALWVRDDTTPMLSAIGGAMKSLETYDDFSCRGRNRKSSGKISEHGKANAIDLKGFTLVDGRYIHLTDMKADKPLREAARRTACSRFLTVLGPGSDGYHEEHIHIDLAERRNDYRLCQWDVREPPPPPPPKVAEKPEAKPDDKAPEKPAEVAVAVPEPAKPEPVKPSRPEAARQPPAAPPQIVRPELRPSQPATAQPQIINRPEARPQVAAAPPEADDDDDEEKVAGTLVSPIQGAIPLPKAKPRLRQVRRKSRDTFHFPFNLLR